jgi:uroporphyrinogen-III synthase
MSLPLEGKTIALAEGRQLEELAAMLEKEGATILRCPLLSILDAPDAEPVVSWLRQLIEGRFSCVILFTGEGLRRLIGFAERAGMREEAIAALRTAKIIVRGPKPVAALRELGLSPTKIAPAPTTEGVIQTLEGETLCGQTIGIQLYSESNEPLTNFITTRRGNYRTVLPYYYAPAADADRVSEMIRKMAAGEVAAIVFTSSPQVDRLFEVAAEQHLEDDLKRGLERTRIAAVGPVVAETVRKKGARVDITPEQGFVMKNLVQHIRRAFS